MHVYDVLKRPIVTEKSNAQAEVVHQYTFEVDRRANKIQVQDAVEVAFNVKVVKCPHREYPGEGWSLRSHIGDQEAGGEKSCRHVGAWRFDPVL